MWVKCCEWVKVAQSCPTLCDPIDDRVRGILQTKILEWVAFLSPWNLPNSEIEPGLLHCRRILYHLSHQGSPRILEWVTISFSRGSSQPRESNPGLPHYGQILYHLSHQGSPRILEWVAYSFSSGSSWLRNRTGVSCIAGGVFTREAPMLSLHVCEPSCFSCVRLCDTMDCSPPGCSVHGILQAKILKWVAYSFSSGSSQPRNQTGWIAVYPHCSGFLSYKGRHVISTQ